MQDRLASLKLSSCMAVLLVCCVHTASGSGYDAFFLTKGHPAKMSSKYDPSDNPQLVVDGNTDGTYVPGVKCIQTLATDSPPWWMTDMEQTYLVFGTRVWNRLDGPVPERFTQIAIGVTSDSSVWTTFNAASFSTCTIWTTVPSVSFNPISLICTAPVTGRYLTVYKTKTTESPYFHFCEIDILVGKSLSTVQAFSVAKGSRTKMVSKWVPNDNPQMGFDGNTNGTYVTGVQCFQINCFEPVPWWMVDLGVTYLIYGASVWNRLDGPVPQRFTQIIIGVTSNPSVWTAFSLSQFDLCSYWAGTAAYNTNPIGFTCSRAIAGRYLTVARNNTGVTDICYHFCEIDILAVTNRDQPVYTAWNVLPSFSSASTSQLFNASVTLRSEMECVFECSKYLSCMYYLYSTASLQCWMFNTYIISDSFTGIINSPGSTFMVVLGAN